MRVVYNYRLSQADYNEIGQVWKKHLHSTNSGSSFLQDMGYTYNERGWLKTSSAQLFAMQLNYNDGTTPQYNGNISNRYWGTPGSLTKNYTYSYDDALNRLTAGVSNEGYTEQNIGSSSMRMIHKFKDKSGKILGYVFVNEVKGVFFDHLIINTQPDNKGNILYKIDKNIFTNSKGTDIQVSLDGFYGYKITNQTSESITLVLVNRDGTEYGDYLPIIWDQHFKRFAVEKTP